MLIDGGPDRSVLRELSAVMPWYDKSIDVVVATHPDADHVSGLVDVLQRYSVSYIVYPDIGKSTTQAESMLASVSRERAREVVARRGQVIDLGGGVRIEILHPDRTVVTAETNEACIVARVVYGKTAFLLPCDAPQGVEKYLVALDPQSVRADVLKAGHHGSRTSSAALFVGTVSPQHAVLSRGCNNRYGHPHKEVLETFTQFNVKTHDTCTEGRVQFISNGAEVELRN
jgi:competence protein ComEC